MSKDEMTPAGASAGGMPARPEELRAAVEAAKTVLEAVAFAEDAKSIAGSKRLVEAIARMNGEEAVAVRRAYLEASLWASRRIGELLPGKGTGQGERTDRGTSSHAGTKFPTSARQRYRQLASLPVESFVAELDRARGKGIDPTQAAMLRLAKSLAGDQPPPRPRPSRRPTSPVEAIRPAAEAGDDASVVQGVLERFAQLERELEQLADSMPRVEMPRYYAGRQSKPAEPWGAMALREAVAILARGELVLRQILEEAA